MAPLTGLPMLLLLLSAMAVASHAMTAEDILPQPTLCPSPPFDDTSDTYTSNVRKAIGSFHQNLSKGQAAANGPLFAPDLNWNYDGNMIMSSSAAVTALSTVVSTSFKGVQAPDYYLLVDGSVGASLFGLQGKQTGPFAGLPLQAGGNFNARAAERFVFNANAQARDLTTVSQTGTIRAQMSKEIAVPPIAGPAEPAPNPQTDSCFRAQLRRTISQLHENANAGNASGNAAFAVEDVQVDENGDLAKGRDAFVNVVAGLSAGRGAFPEKVFHDANVLADGRLGAVEYAWQGTQKKEYLGVPANGAEVRMRGMLFFEFSDQSLVTKVVSIFDEFVLTTQLQGKGGYLYP